ncbi:MAG TPA: hypothetical protein VNZ52_07900 [Candidatus Thermoplasmatota archaeon]|nr:hypothetical protein [Candidatus Thermoplasmatota archaeon]
MGFTEKLLAASRSNNSLLCVGLDPDWETLPPELREEGPRMALYEFCARVVEETQDLVCAYKPNVAFFEADAEEGVVAAARGEQLLSEAHGDPASPTPRS